MYAPEFSAEKFRGLMLYAAHRARQNNDRYFGAVKLNKILYYADFIMFQRFNTSITGATYQKLREGPAPQELLTQRKFLVDSGLAELKPIRVFNYIQSRLVPTADPVEPEWFAPNELTVIDEVLDEFREMTGAEVSEISHRETGWALANEGETIPYETAFLDPILGDGSSELQLKRDVGQ